MIFHLYLINLDDNPGGVSSKTTLTKPGTSDDYNIPSSPMMSGPCPGPLSASFSSLRSPRTPKTPASLNRSLDCGMEKGHRKVTNFPSKYILSCVV